MALLFAEGFLNVLLCGHFGFFLLSELLFLLFEYLPDLECS